MAKVWSSARSVRSRLVRTSTPGVGVWNSVLKSWSRRATSVASSTGARRRPAGCSPPFPVSWLPTTGSACLSVDDAEAVAFRIRNDDEVRRLRIAIPVNPGGAQTHQPFDLSRLVRGVPRVEVKVHAGV